MATSLNLDPFDMWRQAVAQLEEGMNMLGTQSLKSDEVSKTLLEISTVSLQMQHVLEKALSKYFKAINLPSRQEVSELADTLRRIEDKLDQLLPAAPQANIPRPARTRRPKPDAPTQFAPGPNPRAPEPKPRRTAGAKRMRKEAR